MYTHTEKTPENKSRSVATGLPDHLKSGVEHLSGYSLDDVKVHYNSDKPAQLQAHAYAQGTDIHIGPGQEKHLPHEAWHVVQQKQGRVRPTMQMMGKDAINDGQGSAPVQRKLGFEFETGNTFMWKDKTWYKPGRTKGKPMYTGSGFSVEGDTHSTPEIILKETDTLSDIRNAISTAVSVLESVNARKPDESSGLTIMDPATDAGWTRVTGFPKKPFDTEWQADAQATQGVQLKHLQKYLADHLNRDQDKILTAAYKRSGANKDLSDTVKGFLHLIIQFVMDFQQWDGSQSDEGPKNAQVYMARTAYSKMFNSMKAAEQTEFSSLFFTTVGKKWIEDNPVSKATKIGGTGRLIPNKYLDAKGHKVEDKTTLDQWITEIIKNGEKSDAMSPPYAWGGGGVGGYGMGLLDMDKDSIPGTPLTLLEYRQTDNREEMGETSGKNLSMYTWFDFAEEEFSKAKEYDASLEDTHADRRLKMDAHKARSYDFWKGADLRK
jgi:hypothetical protein